MMVELELLKLVLVVLMSEVIGVSGVGHGQ